MRLRGDKTKWNPLKPEALAESVKHLTAGGYYLDAFARFGDFRKPGSPDNWPIVKFHNSDHI